MSQMGSLQMLWNHIVEKFFCSGMMMLLPNPVSDTDAGKIRLLKVYRKGMWDAAPYKGSTIFWNWTSSSGCLHYIVPCHHPPTALADGLTNACTPQKLAQIMLPGLCTKDSNRHANRSSSSTDSQDVPHHSNRPWDCSCKQSGFAGFRAQCETEPMTSTPAACRCTHVSTWFWHVCVLT